MKHFSVSLEDGLHGFPVGREVTIVSEDDANYTVTDGKVAGSASKDSFTNDLDIVDAITQQQKQKAVATKDLNERRAAEWDTKMKDADADRLRSIRQRELQELHSKIVALYKERDELEKIGYNMYNKSRTYKMTPESEQRAIRVKAIGEQIKQLKAEEKRLQQQQ